MKEAVRGGGRSAVEKERTKIRERQRRSITTNIFHGLRKHGGYRLSPRADINEVLRHLACEAGWTVEPDGTTYRSTTATATAVSDGTNNACPLCGGGRKSTAPPTPSGSTCLGGGGGGGECSTTTSPRRAAAGESAVSNHHLSVGGLPLPSLSSAGVMTTNDALLAIYMCGAVQQGARGVSDATAAAAMYGRGQQVYVLHQNSVSNQNTAAGSP